jgi:hypothetical protein
MSTLETENVPIGAAPVRISKVPPHKPRKSVFGRFVLLVLLGGVIGGAVYTYKFGIDRAPSRIPTASSRPTCS